MASVEYYGQQRRPAWPAAPSAPSPRERALGPYLVLMILATPVLFNVVEDPQYPLAGWLVALTVGSFVLALNRPVWLLAPVIVTELTLYSYAVPAFGMAQRLVIILVATVLAVPVLLRRGHLSELRFRRVFVPSLLLVAIATVVNSMSSLDDYVFQYLRFQASQVLVLVLAASLIRSRDDLLWLARITLAAGVLAALAAIWQHFAPAGAPYGAATAETVRGLDGRSVGLSSSAVGLANQMNFVLALLLGVLLCGPWRSDRTRAFLGIVAFCIFAGLTFSYTRSGFFALGPGLLLAGFMLHGHRRLLVVGGMLMAFLMFPALENTGLLGERYFRDADDDQSAATHEALWEVGLAVALDNAVLGIGHEHFEEVSLNYVDAVDDEARAISGAGSIGEQRPHNDFLSVWMSWGIFALIAYLGIFIGALRNFLAAAKHHDVLIRGLAVGGACGVVVYATSSAFHNYLDSSVFLWVYAGLSVALARLAREKPVPPQLTSPHPRGGTARSTAL